MIETHIGKKFLIPQKGNRPPLCQGFLLRYLGDQDGLEHWEAAVTTMYKPDRQEEKMGFVGIGDKSFYFTTQGRDRLKEYPQKVEWL